MARNRRSQSFGILPVVGVLTTPKLIALGIVGLALLRARGASAASADVTPDVEAKPQTSIRPVTRRGPAGPSDGNAYVPPIPGWTSYKPGAYSKPAPPEEFQRPEAKVTMQAPNVDPAPTYTATTPKASAPVYSAPAYVAPVSTSVVTAVQPVGTVVNRTLVQR